MFIQGGNKMRETLNSRERIYKTLNHEEADRFPIDLGMYFATGISVFAYYNLRKYLGLSTDNIQLADTVCLLARVDEDIREMFHCDTVLLNPPFKKQVRWHVRDNFDFLIPEQMNPRVEGNYFISERGKEKMIMPLDGYFFDGSWIEYKDYPEEENLKVLCAEAERLYQETDKFTCLIGEFNCFFTGIEMACDMLTDPDSVIRQNEALLKNQIDKFLRILKYGGNHIGCIDINADMGMQTAPFFSTDCFDQFILPYMKEFIRVVHENSNIKVFLHSCGSIKPLIPRFIEAGLDILNPVQISAANMDPAELKKEFGGNITFWGGGCDTQRVLGFKDEKAVRENVKNLCRIFKTGGGFVFNQVQNIQGDVSPQNIIAMFDEAYKNSFYNNQKTGSNID
jgi:uroporphyrinogen decarboxylase